MVVEGQRPTGENRDCGANGDGHWVVMVFKVSVFKNSENQILLVSTNSRNRERVFRKNWKLKLGCCKHHFLLEFYVFGTRKRKRKNRKLEAMPSRTFSCTGIFCDKGFNSGFFFSANTSRNYMTKVQGDYGFVILVHLGAYLRTWSVLVHLSWMSLDVWALATVMPCFSIYSFINFVQNHQVNLQIQI